MLRTWVSTVRSVSTARGDPALVRPSAISASTSRSRGESASSGWRRGRASRRPTTSGSSAEPPPATRRSGVEEVVDVEHPVLQQVAEAALRDRSSEWRVSTCWERSSTADARVSRRSARRRGRRRPRRRAASGCRRREVRALRARRRPPAASASAAGATTSCPASREAAAPAPRGTAPSPRRSRSARQLHLQARCPRRAGSRAPFAAVGGDPVGQPGSPRPVAARRRRAPSSSTPRRRGRRAARRDARRACRRRA